MVGACIRGRLEEDDGATAIVAERYGFNGAGGFGLRITPERVTTWSGFDVTTKVLERARESVAAG